jgi:hypothetical protein
MCTALVEYACWYFDSRKGWPTSYEYQLQLPPY